MWLTIIFHGAIAFKDPLILDFCMGFTVQLSIDTFFFAFCSACVVIATGNRDSDSNFVCEDDACVVCVYFYFLFIFLLCEWLWKDERSSCVAHDTRILRTFRSTESIINLAHTRDQKYSTLYKCVSGGVFFFSCDFVGSENFVLNLLTIGEISKSVDVRLHQVEGTRWTSTQIKSISILTHAHFRLKRKSTRQSFWMKRC